MFLVRTKSATRLKSYFESWLERYQSLISSRYNLWGDSLLEKSETAVNGSCFKSLEIAQEYGILMTAPTKRDCSHSAD